MKAINKSKIHLYMLGYEDNQFYLMKSNGEIKIKPKRALEWLDAGIQLFNGDSERFRNIIKEQEVQK